MISRTMERVTRRYLRERTGREFVVYAHIYMFNKWEVIIECRSQKAARIIENIKTGLTRRLAKTAKASGLDPSRELTIYTMVRQK